MSIFLYVAICIYTKLVGVHGDVSSSLPHGPLYPYYAMSVNNLSSSEQLESHHLPFTHLLNYGVHLVCILMMNVKISKNKMFNFCLIKVPDFSLDTLRI